MFGRELYDYSDFALGGGWRWLQTHNCVKESRLYVASTGVCPAEERYNEADPRRAPVHALTGSLIAGAIVGLSFLYSGRKRTV